MEYINANEFISILTLQLLILIIILIYNIYNRIKYRIELKKYGDMYNNLEIKFYDLENQNFNKMH